MGGTIRYHQFIAFSFTAIIGTLLHFLSDWTGQQPLVGAVSAVNESVWEHMKLLYVPMLIVALVQRLLLGGQHRCFWCMKLAGIVTGLALIPMLYYTYTGALGLRFSWVDISIYYLAAAAAYLMEGYLRRSEHRRNCPFEVPAIVMIIAIGFVFLVLTFYPPRIPLFQDPVTQLYGLP